MLSIIGALDWFRVPLISDSIANLLSAKVGSVEKQKMGEKIAAAGCSKRSTYLWAVEPLFPEWKRSSNSASISICAPWICSVRQQDSPQTKEERFEPVVT